MAKILRVRRQPPQWQMPTATERQYKADLLRGMNAYIREVKASVNPILSDNSTRLDGLLDDMAAIWNHLQAVGNSIFGEQIARLPGYFRRVSLFNDKQWRRVIKVSTGIDALPAKDDSASGLGINAYRSETWLDGLQSAWVSNNTDLIKTLPVNLNDKIRQLVKNAVVNGDSMKTLREQIQKEYGNSRYRAELIAVDQIQKANSALTMKRQADAGVTHYIWRGIMDGRERATHKAREGRRFAWNDPPPDGHPGQPVRCRCYAEPDFSGSVFDIAA